MPTSSKNFSLFKWRNKKIFQTEFKINQCSDAIWYIRHCSKWAKGISDLHATWLQMFLIKFWIIDKYTRIIKAAEWHESTGYALFYLTLFPLRLPSELVQTIAQKRAHPRSRFLPCDREMVWHRNFGLNTNFGFFFHFSRSTEEERCSRDMDKRHHCKVTGEGWLIWVLELDRH
jgi:hypothetical protein